MATTNDGTEIVALSKNYGDLTNDPNARGEFLGDAKALLTQLGEALVADGAATEYSVRSMLETQTDYAGEVRAYLKSATAHLGVMVSINHVPDALFTRDDGVSAYTQYREINDEGHFPPKPEDQDVAPVRALKYSVLREQVRQMLTGADFHPA